MNDHWTIVLCEGMKYGKFRPAETLTLTCLQIWRFPTECKCPIVVVWVSINAYWPEYTYTFSLYGHEHGFETFRLDLVTTSVGLLKRVDLSQRAGWEIVNVASAYFNVIPYRGILTSSVLFSDTNMGGVVKKSGCIHLEELPLIFYTPINTFSPSYYSMDVRKVTIPIVSHGMFRLLIYVSMH